jgi:hypothetical protein
MTFRKSASVNASVATQKQLILGNQALYLITDKCSGALTDQWREDITNHSIRAQKKAALLRPLKRGVGRITPPLLPLSSFILLVGLVGKMTINGCRKG